MKLRARKLLYSLIGCLCFVTGGAIDAQVMITNGTPPSGFVGVSYSFTFTSTHPSCSAPAVVHWSATGLPTGLSLDINGNLTGTPTTPGSFMSTVTATDTTCGNPPVQQQYTIQIANSGAIVPVTLANTLAANDDSSTGAVALNIGGMGGINFFGQTFTQVFVNNNGNLTFGSAFGEFTPNALALGVGVPIIAGFFADVDTTGTGSGLVQYGNAMINGLNAFVANYINVGYFGSHVDKLNSFQVALIDRSDTGAGNFDIEFNYNSILWETGDASGGTNGFGGTSAAVGYSNGLSGSSNVYFQLTGSLVNGALINGGPHALISQSLNSGVAGRYVFPVRQGAVTLLLSNLACSPGNLSQGASSTCTVTLTGNAPAGAPTVVTLSSNNGALSTPPSVTVATGSNTATFSATASATAGASTAIVTASFGGSSQTATILLSTPLPPPLIISLSPSVISTKIGGSVSASFSARGGSGSSYTFSLSGQPAGIVLGSGTLSGAPTQAGTFFVTVTVTDGNLNRASAGITINVLGITTTSLSGGTAGQFYTASVRATGGSDVYSFSATGLPAGLSITADGSITGTTRTAGTYPVSVTVSSGGVSVTAALNLVIAIPLPLSISRASLPNGTVNVQYSQALAATGGLAPYTWSVSAGSPPQGLTMSSSGIVSGTSTIPGSFTFGVQVTDTAGATATATASLTILPAPLTITTKSLPSGMNGVDYPQQQLMVSGGVSPYTWALASGSSLPSGMALSGSGVLNGVPTVMGTFSVGVTVIDQAKAQGSATFQLTIRPLSNDLILTASSLTFSLSSPATSPPASQVVGVQSTVASQPIAYTLSVSPAAPWLALTNGASTPDSITASITSAALTLSPGPYQTTITAMCTSGSCNGHTLTVAVSLTVTVAPPLLQISTGLLSFATTSAALGPLSQPINLQNAGGGSLGFASISCEAPWCTAGPLPGGGALLGGGVSAAVPVTVNPSLLTPGFYRTQVDIVSSGGKGSVPVTLFISANATMTLAPAGGLFNQPAGSAPGNPNGTFLVSVNSPTPVTFSASVLPGASWLVANTTTGVATSAFPGTVSYSINPAAASLLAVGVYYGEIQVSASGISNSPQDFEVVLNVSPAPAPVTPDTEPGGLLFITTVGGIVPPQTVTVYSGSVTPLTFQASATTVSGGGWLSVTPATGSASQSSPGVTTVKVDASKLSAGVYQGGVSYSLSATAVRTVNVTLIVGSTGGTGGASAVPGISSISSTPSSVTPNAEPRANGCTPKKLVPAQTGLVQSFFAPAGWPTPLAVLLFDDCGTMVNNGQIVATFSNGDPPLALPLANPSQGLYSGTWSPASPSSQVTINVTASAPNFAASTSPLTGAVAPNAVPLLSPNGTLHVFDSLVGGALAPGTIVAIFGQNLAAATGTAATVPLPVAISNSSVIIGGMQAPLYYVSPGQIDAQIPFELLPAQQYQVIVSASGALTTPQSIQLSAATPGLASSPDGTLIAQHSDGTLVTLTSPAKAGEYLVAYLAGLGATTVPVASGAASPSSPLAQPSNTPVLTINGAQSPIYFAGLTPGFVGLYQINFQVPAGLPAGSIMIAVSQNDQTSNATVVPYQP